MGDTLNLLVRVTNTLFYNIRDRKICQLKYVLIINKKMQ